MANWEHEEGVSQRLAELITSEKVSRKLQRKSTKAITQGMSDISHYYKANYRILFLNQPLHTIKYMLNDYVSIYLQMIYIFFSTKSICNTK